MSKKTSTHPLSAAKISLAQIPSRKGVLTVLSVNGANLKVRCDCGVERFIKKQWYCNTANFFTHCRCAAGAKNKGRKNREYSITDVVGQTRGFLTCTASDGKYVTVSCGRCGNVKEMLRSSWTTNAGPNRACGCRKGGLQERRNSQKVSFEDSVRNAEYDQAEKLQIERVTRHCETELRMSRHAASFEAKMIVYCDRPAHRLENNLDPKPILVCHGGTEALY